MFSVPLWFGSPFRFLIPFRYIWRYFEAESPCYTADMAKRQKLLWQAIRRGLLIIADAIKVYVDTAEEEPAARDGALATKH